MKRALIYIENSKGELDWIAPFIRASSEEYCYDIFLNEVGQDREEKLHVLRAYGIDGLVNLVDVNLLNNDIVSFLYKIIDKVRHYQKRILRGRSGDKFYLYVINFICIFLRAQDKKYAVIFRDYNLKDTVPISWFLQNNKAAKVIVFPHSACVQPKGSKMPPPPRRRCDLWLENSKLSLRAKDRYKNEFLASGVPALSDSQSVFDPFSKNVLIFTRDCVPVYGFNYVDALASYRKLLFFLSRCGFNVYVKHHPRDKKLELWREVQKYYDNIEEYNENFVSLDKNFCLALTLFSSVGIYVVGRQVPVIDFSPYAPDKENAAAMPFHYYSEKYGKIVHDLVSYNIFYQESSFERLKKMILDPDFLEDMSKSQFRAYKNYFPANANKNILDAISGML